MPRSSAELDLHVDQVVRRDFQVDDVAVDVRLHEVLAGGAEDHGALGVADAAELGEATVIGALEEPGSDGVGGAPLRLAPLRAGLPSPRGGAAPRHLSTPPPA